jgi:ABC-type glycerol-3-phosphate transport system substrate-binding protein
MMKKLLCVLLAALMLVGTLASCSTGDQTPEGTTGGNNSGADNENETHATLDIPDTRYDGTELCFLARDEDEWSTQEIFSEGMTQQSDNINNAVYERNDRIMNDYGVIITELKKKIGDHYTAVTNEVGSGNNDFQAIISNTSNSASFATNGYLWNLYADEIDCLDFTKPWWDTSMAEGMSIDDKLYFATGDLLTSDNDATFVILFNKQILQDCKIPDLYAMVENKEWTMDKLYEFEQIAVNDKNGDGSLTYDSDVCGLAYTGDVPFCMLFGGNVTMCTKDENDLPIYDLDVGRAQDISDMGKLIFSRDYTIDLNAAMNSSGLTMYEVGNKTFGEGHALFMGEVMQCVTRLRKTEADFGILPYPMYNKDQGDYYSMMHFTASCVSIPKSVSGEKLTMVNAMIEAMAYYAVDTLTEEYYEINLKTKGAKDEQSGPMIDKILANRSCDLAYYYQWGDNAFKTLASCLLPGSNKSVSSQNRKFQNNVEKSIDKLVNAMNKFDE